MSSPTLAPRRLRAKGVARPALRLVRNRLAKGFAGLFGKAGFKHLSIPRRLTLLVLALALPPSSASSGLIWTPLRRANELQRTSLLYTARSIAAGVTRGFSTRHRERWMRFRWGLASRAGC
jgi:hypothetical protein